jgi:hypothetical protein
LFTPAADDQWDPMRTSPEWLCFSAKSQVNPDMVTLNWSELIKNLKEDRACRYSDHVVAAIRTFLEHNEEYREYRKGRLEKLKLKTPLLRIKKSAPEVIIAGCVAMDWIHAGHKLASLKQNISANLEKIGMAGHSDKWTNDLRALKKLQQRAGFTHQKTGQSKSNNVENAIDVVKSLYSDVYPKR